MQRFSEAELDAKCKRLATEKSQKLITQAEMKAEIDDYKKKLALQAKADVLETRNRLKRLQQESKELRVQASKKRRCATSSFVRPPAAVDGEVRWNSYAVCSSSRRARVCSAWHFEPHFVRL